jgi:hypothetical protein
MKKYFLGIIMAAFLCGCAVKRTPEKYIIPHNYVGWVRVNHRVPGAPPVRASGGYLTYRIPKGGVLNTSSVGESGAAKDEFYYDLGNGKLRYLNSYDGEGPPMISGGFASEEETPTGTTYSSWFFVGTQQQADKYSRSMDGDIKAGPIDLRSTTNKPKS